MSQYFCRGDIRIPKEDLKIWAVNACDQYTSQPEYWAEVEAITKDRPSAYHIMLPEAQLSLPEEEKQARIAAINQTMHAYLNEDQFTLYPDAYIYIERTQKDGRVRKGLLGLVDLEEYDYHAHASSLIRATEQTVLERIPPRVAVRKDAPLEMPHLMLLCDDPRNTLLGHLEQEHTHFQPLYDSDLMMDGGHIRGYLVSPDQYAFIDHFFASLANEASFREKYNTNAPVLALAVGDGNHSLASAKECYERLRARDPQAALQSPARYALAEVVNLYDPALDFEPIYRLLTGADLDSLLAFLREAEPSFHAGAAKPGEISLYFQSGLERRTFSLPVRYGVLPVSVLQPLLDAYLSEHPEVSIDYIHGLETVRELGKKEDRIAITFAGMRKEDLFPGLVPGSVLPRKTFSMGTADDKRFYLECRSL